MLKTGEKRNKQFGILLILFSLFSIVFHSANNKAPQHFLQQKLIWFKSNIYNLMSAEIFSNLTIHVETLLTHQFENNNTFVVICSEHSCTHIHLRIYTCRTVIDQMPSLFVVLLKSQLFSN